MPSRSGSARSGKRAPPLLGANRPSVAVPFLSELGQGVSPAGLFDLAAPSVPYRWGTSVSWLHELEDRRLWHPAPLSRPALTTRSTPSRLVFSRPVRRPGRQGGTGGRPPVRAFTQWVPPHVAFHQPARVAVCIRRQARREVLHAKAFYGRRQVRPGRRGPYSTISCRR